MEFSLKLKNMKKSLNTLTEKEKKNAPQWQLEPRDTFFHSEWD